MPESTANISATVRRMKENVRAVPAPARIRGAAAGRMTRNSLRAPVSSRTLALSRYFRSMRAIPLIVPDKKGQKQPTKITAVDDR